MRAVNVTNIRFDPAGAIYRGTVVVAGQSHMKALEVAVAGHREWTATQVSTALVERASAA